jgi:hypothetical protein
MVANPISRGSTQALTGFSSLIAVDYSSTDVTLTTVCRGVVCSTAGTLVCRLEDDSADVTLYLNAGQPYPYRIKIVRHTGTTASMGLYAGY